MHLTHHRWLTFAGYLGALQGHRGGAAWSKHHVQRGRRPVHDEVPANLLLHH